MNLLEPRISSSTGIPASSQRGQVQVSRPPSTYRWLTSSEGHRCKIRPVLGPGITGQSSTSPSQSGESPRPCTTEAHRVGKCKQRHPTAYSRAACLAAATVVATLPAPALAALHAEPANALSLPTWAIHISRRAAVTTKRDLTCSTCLPLSAMHTVCWGMILLSMRHL